MRTIKILLIGCVGILLLLISSCKKDDPPTPPIVKTIIVSEITQTTAMGGGQIEHDGGKPITSRGVCWGITNSPTIADSKTTDGAGDGDFVSSITGLTPALLYYVRAYAINGVGTAYGDPVSFRTSPVALAEITTTIVTDIASTTAKSGGTLVSNGGGEITACGVCWSLNHEPKTTDNKTTDVLSGNSFTSALTNLENFKTYYVRAYATNSAGTIYGNEREFKTSAMPPTVITGAITNRSYRSATAGGEVTADGGNPVTDRGICFATHSNPKFNENNMPSGNGIGPLTVNLTGLEPNTTYYVRAYAATTADTAYGANVEFKTLEMSLPIVTTKQPDVVGFDMAQSGGTVTSDGGSLVSTRGVCWNLTGSPTVNDSKTNDGSGIGSFDSYLTGLMSYYPVYVRAYATNTHGTGYGAEFMFMPCTPPEIANLIANNITGTSVSISYNVDSFDGSYSYSILTMYNPEGYFQEFNAWDQWGFINIDVTGLDLGTIYYYHVLASNTCGLTNGTPTNSFTTLNSGTVSDIEGNTYKTIKIGTQIWMAENLKTSKFKDGTTIPLVSNQTTWANLKTAGLCFYNNEELTYKSLYGALYNWYAVVDQHGLCPDGWHVPSDSEWKTMEMYLGMSQSEADKNTTFRGTTEGGKLKELGISHWQSPNLGATNSSGFTALPAGYRYSVDFLDINQWAIFWTSTAYDAVEAYERGLYNNYEKIDRHNYGKEAGLSVRCIKD